MNQPTITRCPNPKCGRDLNDWPPVTHMGQYQHCIWCGRSLPNQDKPPDRREFSQRMKAAGWKRLPAGGFGWIHRESGTTWEGENYTAAQGIAWEWYHERGELPPATGGAKL